METNFNSEKFTGAKSGMSMFFGYFGEVAREIGMDRALALNTSMSEAMGAAVGQAIRQEMDVKEFDAVSTGNLAGRYMDDLMAIRQDR